MSQGYAFGGKRAELIRKRLNLLKRNPDAAKALMNGKRPKGYPKNDSGKSEEVR